MSKTFNFEDYQGDYVMRCMTEEEAKDFCRVMHDAGRKWCDGQSYLDNTWWDEDRYRTCYNFNANKKGSIDFYAAHGYHVLYWSDFMDKEFTKDDLRNGDVVLRKDGEVEIFIESQFGNFLMDAYGDGCTDAYINRDLTSNSYFTRDVIAVRRPNTLFDMSFDAFEKKLGRLVYERDETVEMTLEEVCKALGKNVKIVKK